MRILQLTSHVNIGGITRYVLSLSERLVKRGHRVAIASGGGHAVDRLATMRIAHWPVPLHTSAEFSPGVFWATRQLVARLRQEPVDLLHAHTRVGQVVADQLSRQVGIPYVTTWHGIYHMRLGRRLWPCTGALTIAISDLVRQHLLQDVRVPAARIRCVYNGIDTAHYARTPDAAAVQACRVRWRIPEGSPIIGSVGRLAAGRVKGIDLLLVATALLVETVPTLHVLIVGDGPRRPFLEDVVERLGLSERVHFIGEAEDIRVPLALMDLFVFTSRWPEAFGLVLVEAMAAGKPVVATKAGAVPEVIQDDVQGWLVPPDDAVALAERITVGLRDRATAQRFGLAGQQRVRDAFDLDRMTTNVEAVYREVLAQTPESPQTASSTHEGQSP